MSSKWMEGKVVFITGAASGIGAATARQLKAHGARLALVDMNGDAVIGTAAGLGTEVLALTADVTRPDSLHEAVARTVAHFGAIDMAWANAGIASIGPLASTDPAAWVRTIDVNLIGAFHTLRAALPEVLRARGHLAVTASLASFVNGPCMSAYAATKAGVEAMCNSMRVEVAHRGVTVGCIHPSWIATPMVARGEELATFRCLRAALPPFLRRDTPVDEAAVLIAQGLAERRDRVYVPGFVRWLRWLRTPMHTRFGERDIRRVMPEVEAAFAADVAALGVGAVSMGAASSAHPPPGQG